jgi:glycosyltransferase involved in cell wall biosynthesis
VKPEETMRLVFWHPFLSIHHAPLIRTLSQMPDMHVELVARMSLERGRADGGWCMPGYGNTKLIEPDESNFRTLVESVVSQSRSDTLHLISDALFNPISRAAWQCCRRKGVPFGFISICPGMYVGKAGQILRRAFYQLYVRRAACAANPILAISAECREFFAKSGFCSRRIYPWAYFVDDPPMVAAPSNAESLRLLYLGRLLKRKRVDLLLRAYAEARAENSAISLSIIGDGPERALLERMAQELNLRDIPFHASIPHQRVHAELQKHDVLVLPTECDDWGVVVNEALQSGLAVITTKNAGAHELIANSGAGIVTRCDTPSLKSAILSLANSAEKLMAMRSRARSYSESITPETAAQYLRAIVKHTLYGTPRPVAPWQTRPDMEIENEIAPDRLSQRRRSVDDTHGLHAADPAAYLDAPR